MKSDLNGTVQQLLNLHVTEQELAVFDSLSSDLQVNAFPAPLNVTRLRHLLPQFKVPTLPYTLQNSVHIV